MKLVRAIRARLISNAWKRKAFYLKHSFPGEITLEREHVNLHLLKITLQPYTFEFVLDAYEGIRELHRTKSARISIQKGQLVMEIDDICVNPTTSEEILILNEIFVHGSYNVDFSQPAIVMDVGMNVGLASLFFASMPQIEKVFGFEPFKPTFVQAEANLALNNTLSKKICLENFGLGSRDEKLEVSYDYTNKGQVGIHGTSSIRSALDQVEKQTILIREASGVLKKIIQDHSDKKFILKLDCEGSEYLILEDLASNQILPRLNIIFIEWHERGPETLLSWLRGAGFTSFYQRASAKTGMIYASR